MIIRSRNAANYAEIISVTKIHFEYKVMLSPKRVKRIQRKDHRKEGRKDNAKQTKQSILDASQRRAML